MRFEHPELLWLMLVLPAVTTIFLWWTGRTRRRLLTQFIQARLLPELTVPESPQRSQGRALLWAGATALLGLALARPQWGSSWEEARQKGLDIVVAIDTSKSMLAEDLRPHRLARAKLAALDLMRLAEADRLGLIAFAGGAFLQCPLTLDDGVFKQCVDDLNVNIIPQGGTAIAEAIRTATQALSDDQNFQVLVLFTDGEDHDADAVAAAREAAEAGLRIYTVGLGTPEGELLRITDAQGRTDFVRDPEGQVVKSRLNEALLQEIATAAQGFYLPLRGADTVDVLYEKGLAPLPKSESEARLYRRYHERYHWPLGLALVLIVVELLWPRRAHGGQRSASAWRATPTVATRALLLLLACPLLAHASPTSARREFEAGQYVDALEEFDRLREKEPADARLHYNAGAAAYRAGRFDDALERFNAAIATPELELQQQAYYNRGNAHYRVGEVQQDMGAKRKAWEQAITDYEAALKLNEADDAAQFNLEFVKRRLQELEQQQQQQDQNDQNQEEKSEDNRNQQNQQSQQGDQQQDEGKGQQDNQQPQSQQQNQQKQQEPQDQQQQANPQQQQGEQDKQEPQPEPSPEQQSHQNQGAEPEQPEDEAAQQQPGQPVEPGTMTPEQAQRILDALKGGEQMLPTQLLSPQPRQPPAKDW